MVTNKPEAPAKKEITKGARPAGAAGSTKKTVAPVKVKKENKVVRYFKEVRAELRKVVWPTRQTTLRLTGIVLAVTVVMSAAMGLLDFLFSKLFSLILG